MALKGYLNDMTLRACRVVIAGHPKGMWFPKSQILNKYNPEPHYIQSFTFTRWILRKKKLIREYGDMAKWT